MPTCCLYVSMSTLWQQKNDEDNPKTCPLKKNQTDQLWLEKFKPYILKKKCCQWLVQ